MGSYIRQVDEFATMELSAAVLFVVFAATTSGFKTEYYAEDRFCTPLCSEDNSGCDPATQYCAPSSVIGLGFGCCRTKSRSGDPCVPKDNGIDCMSGNCNNLLPSWTILGVTWNFGFWNLWFGLCA